MTTLEAEIKLMRYFKFNQNLIVPTVTNMSNLVRFETDLLILSNCNYATGVEIKVSLQDLRNDLNKNHIKYTKNKKSVYFREFKYFYYAIPEELIKETESQIFDFMGIINLTKLQCVKSPSVINNYKWKASERLRLAELGCMRIYSLKSNIKTLKQ